MIDLQVCCIMYAFMSLMVAVCSHCFSSLCIAIFWSFAVLHGKVMHQVGVEVVGIGALKLTGFLKEQMQQKNIYFGSLYTVRALKEVFCFLVVKQIGWVGRLFDLDMHNCTVSALQVNSS